VPPKPPKTHRLLVLCLGLIAAVGPGCRPEAGLADSPTAPEGGPDQVLADVRSILTTPEGTRTAMLQADSGLVYPADHRVDLRRLTVTVFDRQGAQAAVVTADRGRLDLGTGALEAAGKVVVAPVAGGRLSTEFLVFDGRKLELRTDSSFVFDSPRGSVRGRGFQTGPDLARVRGTPAPR
jgi:LPS export ABC transporter protein LptC